MVLIIGNIFPALIWVSGNSLYIIFLASLGGGPNWCPGRKATQMKDTIMCLWLRQAFKFWNWCLLPCLLYPKTCYWALWRELVRFSTAQWHYNKTRPGILVMMATVVISDILRQLRHVKISVTDQDRKDTLYTCWRIIIGLDQDSLTEPVLLVTRFSYF